MSTRIGIIRTTAAAGLLGLAAGAGAAVYDDAADGPWDDPATWGVAGGCPVAGDAVVIDSGCTITVAGQAAFGSDTTRSRLSRGLVEIPAGASLLHVGKAGCEVTAQEGGNDRFARFGGGGVFTNEGVFVICRGSFRGGGAGFRFVNTGTLKSEGGEWDPAPGVNIDDAEVLENRGLIEKANASYRRFDFKTSGDGVFRSLGGTIRNASGGGETFFFCQAADGSGVWTIRDTTFDVAGGDIAIGGIFDALHGNVVGDTYSLILKGGGEDFRTCIRRGGDGPLTIALGGKGLLLVPNDQGRTSALDAGGGLVTNATAITIDHAGWQDGGLRLDNGTVVSTATISLRDRRRLEVSADAVCTNIGTVVIDTDGASGNSAIFVRGRFHNLGTVVKRGADSRGIDADGTGGQPQEFLQHGVLAVEKGRLTSGCLDKFECLPSSRFRFTLRGAPSENAMLEFGGWEGRTFTLKGKIDIEAADDVEAGTYRLIAFVNGGMNDGGLEPGDLPPAWRKSTLTVVPGTGGHVDVTLAPTPPAGTILIVRSGLAAAAPDALVNGGFTAWTAEGPVGWSGWNPAVMTRCDGPGGLPAVRLVNEDPGAAVYLQQEVPLRPEWRVVLVSARLRAQGLKLGAEGWHEARVALRFLGPGGSQVGGYPAMPRLREDSDWILLEVLLDKPEGATHLQLQPGLWLATGTLELADLRVRGYASRADRLREEAGPLPPPDRQATLLAVPGEDAPPAGWSMREAEAVTPAPAGDDGEWGWLIHPQRNDSRAGGTRTFAVQEDWTLLELRLRVKPMSFAPGPETGPPLPNRWRQVGAHVAFLDADGREMGDGVGAFVGPHMDPFRDSRDLWHVFAVTGGVPPGAVLMRVSAGFFNGGGTAAIAGLRLIPSTDVVCRDAALPPGRRLAGDGAPAEERTPTRGAISLDGLWRFAPAEGSAAGAPACWGLVEVPGDWQRNVAVRGDSREWLLYRGEDVARAWYECVITVPPAWAGRVVELDLDRVSTDARVFVDGRPAGEIGWPCGRVDLTSFLKPGVPAALRLLVVAVKDREMVPVYMGYAQEELVPVTIERKGLIGGARLLSRPPGAHVADLLVRPSTRRRELAVNLDIGGAAEGTDLTVAGVALNEQGQTERTFAPQSARVADGRVTVAWPWENPRLWDVARPNRYLLRLTIGEGGATRDVVEQPFGFREFWIEGRRFFLNGTEIRLRPANLDYGAMPSDLLARGFTFGNNWPKDLTARGSDTEYDDRLIADADAAGFLVSGKAPHMGEYAKKVREWRENPALRAEYRRMIDAHVRRWRNHPSVVMWAHTANGFQNQVDGTPWLLGRRGFSAVQEYVNAVENALEAIAMIKETDPTRPVYAHFGTYAGDVYTSNLYLNFIPLQERLEWPSAWARDGEMPFMAVEFGPPLYASLMRGRAGYTHQGHSEPFLSEWAAVYLGPQAYAWEPAAYRETMAARFRKGDLQHEYDPHHRHGGFTDLIADSPAFTALLDIFITETWRSWRTLGVSGGMVPWHHDRHPALERVNRDTLAWLAGAGGPPTPDAANEEVFTAKTHHYRAGERLRKQAVLINDTREAAPFSLRWRVSLAGGTLAEGSREGTLGVSETAFFPVEADLPAESTDAAGAVTLAAVVAGTSHSDRLDFTVFAADPPAGEAATAAVFDPEGATTRWLAANGWRTVPWNDGSPPSAAAIAVVGRHALDRGGAVPGDVRAFVAGGGRLLVMGQDPAWLRHALHLRTSAHVSRRVFPVGVVPHPILAGLTEDNLRDWNGSGTLVEPYPCHPGFEWTPSLGWHWGNRGSVCSAPVEKPHRGGWRPLLECGFDLACTPLMELDHGRGRVTLCTLDLEERTVADPAAGRLSRRLLAHVAEAPVAPRAGRVAYVGGAAGAATLDLLGVCYDRAGALAPGVPLTVLGPDAVVDDDALRAYAEAGGRVLALRRETAAAPLGTRLTRRENFTGSLDVPSFPEAAGLGAGDLRWRNTGPAWLAEPAGGLEVGAGGQLARRAVGRGVIVYAQLGPDSVPADEKRYFRFTRWRQTRALSQVLANLGATFGQDERFLALLQAPDHHVPLVGPWQAWRVTPLPESPWREWNAFRPISAAAALLTGDGPPPDGGETVPVPAYLESYGPAWRFIDGEFVFRREIDWPAHAAGKPLFWSLGRVDENEESFVNGTPVGASRHWLLPRGHAVPAGIVKAGRNVLAVRVWDEGIHGGMCGSPEQLYIAVAGEDPGFYHPDHLDDDVSRDPDEKGWAARAEQWKVADNPCRYCRW